MIYSKIKTDILNSHFEQAKLIVKSQVQRIAYHLM